MYIKRKYKTNSRIYRKIFGESTLKNVPALLCRVLIFNRIFIKSVDWQIMRPQYDFGHKFHITNPFCAVLRKGLRKILGINQISKYFYQYFKKAGDNIPYFCQCFWFKCHRIIAQGKLWPYSYLLLPFYAAAGLSGNMSPHIRDTVAIHLTRLIEKITKPLFLK